MPNWERFSSAVVERSSQVQLLAACERLWAWLDLPEDARRAAVAAIARDAEARWLALALPFVRLRLQRDIGQFDPAAFGAWLLALDERVRSGRAGAEESAFARRYAATFAIAQDIAVRHPAALQPVPPADPRLEQIVAAVPALGAAMNACAVGRVTREGLAALERAVAAFEGIARDWAAPHPTDHAWWLGQAAITAGRGAL